MLASPAPAVKNARLVTTLSEVHGFVAVAAREAEAAAARDDDDNDDDDAAIRKAGAYMYAAAALERACREGMRAVIAEINAHGAPPERWRVSLFALHCHAELDALGPGPKSLDRLGRAAAMFETVAANAPASLAAVLPLDGRTPRAAHFATMWRILGLPGEPLPDPALAAALDDLADGRNDLAHGVRDAITFGRSRSVADVRALIARVAQAIAHLYASADAYLDQRLFLR
ncbi:MAG TPA: hypothetical protein VFP84_00355 [Kofleriaceae bacterium]|nr:hypothetical protein [Kofleriaceae bacterium]